MNKRSKKSQAWGLDLIIAMTIFFIGIVVFFVYSINYNNEKEENFYNLASEASFIADNILSSGYPENWDENNVKVIGLEDNGKISNVKLEQFYNLAENNYENTKKLLGVTHEYYVSFGEEIFIGGQMKNGIGNEEGFLGTSFENSENAAKINRITILNNKPTNLYVYVWD